ncbi:tetratricopeptide repeat protein [Asanoa sp. NPDC049518]|uniref:ATP-binding protein n=1 Tax=unclassified Asanoa TaxID=2685164 RepID=UPI00341245BE
MTQRVAPPIPDDAGSAADFVAALKALRLWSDLTYRQLATRADEIDHPLPPSTTASVLGRSALPRRDFVASFVRACGLSDDQAARWLAARDALAAGGAAARADDETDQPAPWPAPAMLPPDLPDFTGRATELAALANHLSPGEDRALPIVAISGMPGAGKTALAAHVAHAVAPSYPDGQLWINLGGAEACPLDPGEVLSRLLRALGVHSRAIPAAAEERAEVYRMRLAGQRVLVVLDNARSEAQVRPLLPGSGSCAVLVTSRTRLSGIEGAHQIELGVLPRFDALRLLGLVGGAQRVAGQSADAAEIVDLCGNLPLAVRVAGARLAARPSWPLARLAALLGDEVRRLDSLSTGDLAVRSSLMSSYRELDPPQRRLFRLLGLLEVADFPAWVAAVVLRESPERAAERVEALVDAQLLTIAGTDPARQTRYRFHDLVRVFARELALAEESERCRRHVVDHALGGWLALAERMAPKIPGPCFAPISGSAPRPPVGEIFDRLGEVDPLDWFDAERAALPAAVRQACRLDLSELAFDLAGALEKYFDVRGMYTDWESLNTVVLETCRRTGNRLGEAVMLRGLMDVTTWTAKGGGDVMGRFHADADRLFEMFDELGHEAGAADAAVNRSWALTAAGDHAGAVDAASRALRLAERAAHPGGQVRARLARGLAHYESGRYDVAIAEATRALDDARALDNDRCLATALQFCGFAYREAGDADTSLRLLEQALTISRAYCDHYAEVLTLLGLARLHLRRGDARARGVAEASLALSREFQLNHYLADALAVLGEIELADGRPARAVTHLEESVAIWKERGWVSFHATALTTLGQAYAAIAPEAAHLTFGQAQELFAQLGNDAKVAELAELMRTVPPHPARPG